MSIIDLIDNHYKEGFKSDISEEELLEFIKEYMLVKKLKDEYKKGEVNRKELGREILSRAKNLKVLMRVFEVDLLEDKAIYEWPDYISDYNKILEVLLRLANNGEREYILKEFQAEEYGSLETKHGSRSGIVRGQVWTIGEKDVLDNVDNSEPYYGFAFRTLTTNIIKDNHSMIVISNHYYESNVLPVEFRISATKKKFGVNGIVSDLCCYTYNDELGAAVEKLDNYIENYGGNVDNISVDTIIENINKIDEKEQKILTKAKYK